MSNYYQYRFEEMFEEFDADKRTPDDYPMWYRAIGSLIYHSAPGGATDAIRDIVGYDAYDNMIDFLEEFQLPETCECCGQDIPNECL